MRGETNDISFEITQQIESNLTRYLPPDTTSPLRRLCWSYNDAGQLEMIVCDVIAPIGNRGKGAKANECNSSLDCVI